jgi:hypothetical protein
MCRFLPKSLSALLLLLVSCSFSQAQSVARDGYWWTDQTLNFKLGFLSGYTQAMTKALDVAAIECVAGKGSGQIPARVTREMITDCKTRFAVARWDFQEIPMGQLQEGIDTFYADLGNKQADINDAIWYVRDRLKGRPAAELAQRLENIRANTRR